MDAADLSRLADIVQPAPVPWWPPAPGWWILAVALLVAVIILLAARLARWRRDAYRRAALTELDALGDAGAASGFAPISAILKRTALVAYPRTEVASLTGPAWLAFLDRSGGGRFSALAGPRDPSAGDPSAGDTTALLAEARRWVKCHRVEG